MTTIDQPQGVPARFRAWQLQAPAASPAASKATGAAAKANSKAGAEAGAGVDADADADAPLLGSYVVLGVDDLSPGNVVVRIDHASLNYKDALAAAGRNRIVRDYPRIGGIDFVGTVIDSADPDHRVGDAVIGHGFGLGVDHDGGFAEVARVDGDWLLPLPEGLGALDAATIGVAGYTAALSLYWLEHNGLRPGGLPVVVTGATGGVATVAIDLLASRGYEVVALTGKPDAADWLKTLGATTVETGTDLQQAGRPLESARFGGAIDSVGGAVLAGVLSRCGPDAVVAAFGNAAGLDLATTVLPFILRGVKLIGINANSPMPLRREIWRRLATDWRPRHLTSLREDVPFEALPEALSRMLGRQSRGRLVISYR